MVGYPEIAAAAALLLVLGAEFLHARRVERIASLAFGPKGRPAAWVTLIPFARSLAASAVRSCFILEEKRAVSARS